MPLNFWLPGAGDDLRVAVRRLIRDKETSAAILLALASGIALAVAVFSVADVVLRRPLPIDHEDRVVVLWGEASGSTRTLPLSPQHFELYRHEARALSEVAGTLSIDAWAQPVRNRNESFRTGVSPVSGNFFSTLGSNAIRGRMLRPDDDRSGAEGVAVLSYAMWRGRFAGSPEAIGARIELRNSRVVTIVGVAPPGLDYPQGSELWVPFAVMPPVEIVPVGRLARGASAAHAAAELRSSFERRPDSEWRGLGAAAEPIRRLTTGENRTAFIVLSIAAAVLLLTACFNAANLLLLRGTARRGEIAVRRALGAGRMRLIRLLLIEGFVLSAPAVALGAWLASALVRAFLAVAPANIPRLDDISVEGISLGIAAVVGLGAATGSAVFPALWLSRERTMRLDEGRAGPSGSGTFAQRAMVAFQIGLSVFALFAAGLLGRTLQTLHAIEPGLDADHVAVVELSWPDTAFENGAGIAAMYEELLPRLATLPDVASAATVNVVPFTGATGGWDGPFSADAQTSPQVFTFAVVGADYFDTMGIRLLNGRAFTRGDRQGSAPVAIVSEDASRMLGGEMTGKRIRLGSGTDWRTVVGVAADTRYRAIRQSAPTVYLPLAQFQEVMPLITTLVVRTIGNPAGAVPSIRAAVAETNRNVTVLQASALSTLIDNEFARPRLNAILLSLIGAGAALLAAAGLYAVLAAAVRLRRRELAIRHAIGATPAAVARIVLIQGAWLTGAGLAGGLIFAFASARVLDSLLYGITANDLPTVAGVIAAVVLTSLASIYIPARRAGRVDVSTLLRNV